MNRVAEEYKLPVIANPVISERTNPKIHATNIAEKNEGTDIPNTEKKPIALSIKDPLFNPEIIPKKVPNKKAMIIEVIASIAVLKKTSAIISDTFLPVLVKDWRK